MKWHLPAFLALAVLLVGGCASAPHRIAEEDTAAGWSGRAYSNLLIIGAYDDRAYRVGAETVFAERLEADGVAAAPSYDLIPELDALENDAELAGRLEAAGHDGVLTVATLDEGYDYDLGDYYATRGMVYLLGGRPGAGTDMGSFLAWAGSGLYSLYVGLWDTATMRPVWQMTTNSESTGSESGDTQALAEFVAGTLRKKGLLESPGSSPPPR